MIVVDTNIVTYRFIRSDRSALAFQAEEIDPDWVVPELCRHEFLNVLVTFDRQGILTVSECDNIWTTVDLFLTMRERPMDLATASALALRKPLTAYDAQFVALAQALGVRCLTEDRALLRACPDVAVSLEEFCSPGGA